MWSSTSEYFTALRNEDYLHFLEWPAFVGMKYRKKDQELGPEALINCLVFEWLKYGYKEEDMKRIAILYAIYELDVLIEAKDLYALMTITSVLCICMIFDKYELKLSDELQLIKDAGEIYLLIETQNNILNEKIKNLSQQSDSKMDGLINQSENIGDDFEKTLVAMSAKFMKEVSQVEKSQATLTAKKIGNITQMLSVIKQYHEDLQSVPIEEQNELFQLRIGIVLSLYSYVQGQKELTNEASLKIVEHVQAIRSRNPKEWEERHLQNIVPPRLMEKAFGMVSYLSRGFFTCITPKVANASQKEPRTDLSSGM
jgi:hypothetical protein